MPRTSLFLLSRAIHKTKLIPKLGGSVREPLSCASSTVHTHLPFKSLASRNNSPCLEQRYSSKNRIRYINFYFAGIYLLRPDNLLTSYNIVPGISDYSGILLEVEWDEIYR
jgi:hypothetical protein